MKQSCYKVNHNITIFIWTKKSILNSDKKDKSTRLFTKYNLMKYANDNLKLKTLDEY